MWRLLLVLAVLPLAQPALAQSADPAAPAEITLHPEGYGWRLTDTKGLSLYTYTKDQPGKPPACVGECAKIWLPLAASADAKATGAWSIAKRADGSQQWAYQGRPLYSYSRDAAPGEMNGDELQQQWNVAVRYIAMPPGFSVQKTANGHLLVDPKRMTLYTSAADSNGKSKCKSACARTWRAVEAWQMAAAVGKDWSVVERDDGTRQWAYKGKPLYRYAGDFAPTEMAGDKVEGHAAIVLQPPPLNPAWVTYHESDGGELLTDANGKTLYAFDMSRPSPGNGGFALPKDTWELWKPVVADADAKAVGYWSIISTEDAPPQWAYKGAPVFTNIRDKEPGDLNGVRRMDWFWHTIMRNGQSMPGSGL